MSPVSAARHRAAVAPAAGVAAQLGRAAVRALYREATLEGKPGLVGPVDSGAHQDMTLATFYRSLFALRGYFPAIAALGAADPALADLQACGRDAEAAMLRATGGVNTHRGAIFHLGLLCAAGGALAATGGRIDASRACAWVRGKFGGALRAPGAASASHGAAVARSLGVRGARAEAASGFVSARRHGLPALRAALAVTADRERAGVHALYALVAHVDDSNLAWRGGSEGLAWAQARASKFLADGGAFAPDWRARTASAHREFVARRLSPGGSADLLAVTYFLDALDTGAWRQR
jgi:triphosphoribosyl-dephospho-CoA synthase